MAEAFVFLSGISCGIFYSGLVVRNGYSALATALAKRSCLLYVFYAGSSAATIALIWSMRGPLREVGALAGQWALYAADPAVALLNAVLLVDQPSLPGILILYIALTLVAIPLFFLTARRSLMGSIAISGAIWLTCQLPVFGLEHPNKFFPSFNPLAWQFLFCIGMAYGVRLRSAPTRVTRLHKVLPLAWGVVTLSLLWKIYFALAVRRGLPHDWHRMLDAAHDAHKYNLAIERIAHFLSVATLIGVYVRPQARFLWSPYDFIAKVGRRSLETFSLGTVLSVLGTVIFLITASSNIDKLAFNAAAILATALLAVGLSVRPGLRSSNGNDSGVDGPRSQK